MTAGVLSVGVLAMTGMGNSLFGDLEDVRSWHQRIFRADFYVRAVSIDSVDTMNIAMPAMPLDIGEQLRQLDGVDHVGQITFTLSFVEGHGVIVMARSFAANVPLGLALEDGDEAEVLAGLQRGEVVIGTGLAQQTGLKAGNEITLNTRLGPQRVRIAGIAKEYTGLGMALYMGWATGERLLYLPGVHGFEVRAHDGQQAKVAQAPGSLLP